LRQRKKGGKPIVRGGTHCVPAVGTLLVGGRGFSVVYNTWRVFFLYTITISIVFFE
jgi:hypothetical protein